MPDLVNKPWTGAETTAKERSPSGEGAPSTMKSWNDCGIEEKVERLRDALRGQRDAAGFLNSFFERVAGDIERLGDHSHDALGRVVVGFRGAHARGYMAGESSRAHDPLA